MTDTPRPAPGELIDAVRQSNLALVKRLLREGACVDEKGEFGKTPLCFAVVRGSLEMAELLISAGAEINVRNDSGYTLVSACISNMTAPQYEESSARILRMLIHKGAALDSVTRNGTTALQWAQENGCARAEEIVNMGLRTRARYAQFARAKELMDFHNTALDNQAFLKKHRVKTVLKNKP